MDINVKLNRINTLTDYIELTQVLENGEEEYKILLNSSTVFSLKKIRSLEIEYFNKCDGSGTAFKLFERLLSVPPSKTWGLLGSDLISLIQYWLDAVRKHLISHHIHWWTFLKQLLGFIKVIRQKDLALSNVLVEETSESMLDLATSGKPDLDQCYEILHTFNCFCAESSREIRAALRKNFEPYFIKLAALLSHCGDAPTQLSCLLALLRWLQPRHDPATRRDAAASWFPASLYSQDTVEVFLNRAWLNFMQDAREFLNCHNEKSNLVTSVICKHLMINDIVLVTGLEKRVTWLDINVPGSRISLVLEPGQRAPIRALHTIETADTLAVSALATDTVVLHRESSSVKISIETLEPPHMLASSRLQLPRRCTVHVTIPDSDLARVDGALRAVYQDKYQLMLDTLSTEQTSKPGRRSRRNSKDSTLKSSQSSTKLRTSGCGFASRLRNIRSPSSVSTSSLAQLHVKLAALPKYEFTKEPVSVCARPELSIVSERNESEYSNSLETTLQIGFGGCGAKGFLSSRLKSQSDGESAKGRTKTNKNVKGSQSEEENKIIAICEEEIHDSILSQCTNNSVISATIEHAEKNDPKGDDLIELLVHEALSQPQNEEQAIDSGINTGEKKTQDKPDETETIEDTQFPGFNVIKKPPARNFTVVSKSSSNESNTEIENPVNYVNVRKRNQRRNSTKEIENTNDNATFDIQAVENFFSQHFAENHMGELIISPTLAKKINETSSEASDECPLDEDFNLPNEVLPDLEIVECLNSIVDRVCVEFEKCAQYFEKEGPVTEILEMAKNCSVIPTEKDMPLQEVGNLITEPKKKGKAKQAKKTPQKAKPVIKLQFKKKTAKGKGKSKLQLEPVTEMSTIIEEKNESTVNKVTPERKISSPENGNEVLVRRKRKLYSPKDDEKHFQNNDEDVAKTVEDADHSDDDAIPLAVIKKDKLSTPKSTSASTCYKEIEKERKKFKRTRAQKLKSKPSPTSPKTKKLNEDFEKLRDNIDSNEHITLIDKKSLNDIVIYNFTSDSEDEDFKQKRIEIQKRTSTTTVGSGNSVMSTRRGRAVNKVNYKETAKDSSSDANTKPVKSKRVRRRKSKAPEVKIDRPTDLADERMREIQPEVLNTSFTAETNDKVIKELTPKIIAPEIETIPEENEADKIIEKKKGKPTKTEKNKKQDYTPLNIIRDDDRTVSPLPGLVIETEVAEQNNADESLTTNLIERCQNIYKNGPQAYNDTVTTQNMLSDIDKVPSPQMNITEELRKVYDIDDNQIHEEGTKPDDQNYNSDVIDDTMNSGYVTDRSISSKKSKKHKLNLKRKENPSSVSNSIKADKNKSANAGKDKISKKEDYPKPKKRRSSIDEIKTVTLEKDYTSKRNESPKAKKRRSSIDEIVCQDIILISSQARTRSRKSTKSQEIEQIDITTVSDAKSEKSFPSEGINAHGDIDELPPSPKLLKQKFVPREIQDMDQSVREFFEELSRKLNDSNNSSKSQSSEQKRDEIKVGRKRQIDIVREEPADVSSSQKSSKINKDTGFVKHDYDISKWLPSRCDTESENSSQSSKKTPTVSLVKLRPEEVEKWLPSNKSTRSSAKTTKSKRCSPRLKNRKSQISPIELDKFFGSRKSRAVLISKPKDIPNNWFKDTISSKRNIEPEPNTSKSEEETIRKDTRNYWSFRPRRTHQSSPNSDYKSKDSSPKLRRLLRSPIATSGAPKRKKLDLTSEPIDLGSRQSSNVDDWLRCATANSTANTLDASAEFLQNLMEKLDTTLAEIHQNTAKDFLGLFVDAYKQLSELKAARHQMYQETTTNILSTVTRVLERQFEEMDQRAEEGDQKFMTWLKERASAVLRQDSQQKRAMVMLLREDMQAVTEHLHKKSTQ